MNTKQVAQTFDPHELAKFLTENLPKVIFALHLGSSQNGQIFKGSDVDIALYTDSNYLSDDYLSDLDKVNEFFGNQELKLDLGVLNRAEPVFRFEALSGKLLFCRDVEVYQDFFVRTCKAYEMQMQSYERQHKYRVESYSEGTK